MNAGALTTSNKRTLSNRSELRNFIRGTIAQTRLKADPETSTILAEVMELLDDQRMPENSIADSIKTVLF